MQTTDITKKEYRGRRSESTPGNGPMVSGGRKRKVEGQKQTKKKITAGSEGTPEQDDQDRTESESFSNDWIRAQF